LIVSPADGRIIYVKSFDRDEPLVSLKFGREIHLEEIGAGFFPTGVYLMGIRLSPLDVHVNRSPIDGKVRMVKHRPGRLVSLSPPGLLEESERNSLIIENEAMTVAVIQMAAYLVRRTVVRVREGVQVRLGEKIGSIRLGSQVDLVIPREPGIRVRVGPGMSVKAGESVVATFDPEPGFRAARPEVA